MDTVSRAGTHLANATEEIEALAKEAFIAGAACQRGKALLTYENVESEASNWYDRIVNGEGYDG